MENKVIMLKSAKESDRDVCFRHCYSICTLIISSRKHFRMLRRVLKSMEHGLITFSCVTFRTIWIRLNCGATQIGFV